MTSVNGKASGTASLHRLPVMWSGFKDSSQKPIRLSQTYEMANSCARPYAKCSRKFKKKKSLGIQRLLQELPTWFSKPGALARKTQGIAKST